MGSTTDVSLTTATLVSTTALLTDGVSATGVPKSGLAIVAVGDATAFWKILKGASVALAVAPMPPPILKPLPVEAKLMPKLGASAPEPKRGVALPQPNVAALTDVPVPLDCLPLSTAP